MTMHLHIHKIEVKKKCYILRTSCSDNFNLMFCFFLFGSFKVKHSHLSGQIKMQRSNTDEHHKSKNRFVLFAFKILTLDHWKKQFENEKQNLIIDLASISLGSSQCHTTRVLGLLDFKTVSTNCQHADVALCSLNKPDGNDIKVHWPSSTSENTIMEPCIPAAWQFQLLVTGHVTFSGYLDRNAACRGPEIEFGVACTQCQPGAPGVPLKATHGRCLLKHSLQAHLLHVPHPDNTGHVVYDQRNTFKATLSL